MSDDDPLGLVVPLFDEAARVREFVPELVAFIDARPVGSQLIFVDDGSRDGTLEAVGALVRASGTRRVRTLRRPHLGKGAAVAAGLGALEAPLRAFCDLDLATPLDDLLRIVAVGARPGVLAIGSRDLAGSSLVRPEAPSRELLGRAYNRVLQAVLTPGVVDTQCGAKAARAEVWNALLPHAREPGFAWDAEVVALAARFRFRVAEVPIAWSHDPRSKVRVLRDGVGMLRAIPRIWRRHRGSGPASATVAPEIFDIANAERLLESDRTHWWFRSKAAFVATALLRTEPASGNRGRLVDAGAGAGGVTALLGWSADEVTVVEGSAALVARAVDQHGLSGVQGSVNALPFAPGSLSVLCLLDVIEHLDGPVAALEEARTALAADGRLVVNVPAHAWLWSAADEALGHRRRYTRKLLTQHLRAAGFEVVVLTHVFSWLVPPVWLARRVVRPAEAALGLDQVSPLVDRASMLLTWGERQLVGRLSLPIGTSILAVAVPA